MYFYALNVDSEWNFYTKCINRLLVWFYKLQKQKLVNDIYMICGNEFKFYKKRFDDTPDICYECDPEYYGY